MSFDGSFNKHSRQISLALLDLSDYVNQLTSPKKQEANKVVDQMQKACTALLNEVKKISADAIGEVKQHYEEAGKLLVQMKDQAKSFLDSNDRASAYEHLNDHYALLVQTLTVLTAETS